MSTIPSQLRLGDPRLRPAIVVRLTICDRSLGRRLSKLQFCCLRKFFRWRPQFWPENTSFSLPIQPSAVPFSPRSASAERTQTRRLKPTGLRLWICTMLKNQAAELLSARARSIHSERAGCKHGTSRVAEVHTFDIGRHHLAWLRAKRY